MKIDIQSKTLDQLKKEIIEKIWRHHNENNTHTAIALGVSLRSLRTWLKEYGIERTSIRLKSDTVYKHRILKALERIEPDLVEREFWYNRPTVLLAGKSPCDMVQRGRGKYVLKLAKSLHTLKEGLRPEGW